jgi:branched-chain amino acid transport system ATP-binding protein
LAHVPEDRALFYQLTVAENLRLARRPKGQSLSAALESVLGYFPALQPLMRRRAGLLSGGEQQMLVLARALITKPRVLMVDEMSLGLAPLLVQPLLEVLRRVADEDGTAVLVVEQHVHSILRVADRAYVLNHGTLVLEGPAAELAQRDDVLRASYLGEAELEPSSSSSKHRGPLV